MSDDFGPATYASCPVCGAVTFPVHELPPCGHDATPNLHELDEPGVVFSWTRTYSADGATVLAMADFLDGAIRITAPVVGVDGVAIGDQVVARAGGVLPFVLAPVA